MEIIHEEPAAPVIDTKHLGEDPGTVAVEPHCPKCTGPMVRCAIGRVSIYGWWLERVSRPAGTLGPPRSATSDLIAKACVRCGYTEFYAVDPSALIGGDDHN